VQETFLSKARKTKALMPIKFSGAGPTSGGIGTLREQHRPFDSLSVELNPPAQREG
jgi:hypothetical protein